MSLRYYSEAEFEEELKTTWGLTPTETVTKTTKLWKTSDNLYVTVPLHGNGDKYPHYYLGEVAEQIKAIKLSTS